MTPDRRILLALFAVAFGLRVLYAAVIGTDPEINPNPYNYDYVVAKKMATDASWITRPYSPRAPGYHVFLAGIFFVFGTGLWQVIFVQAALGGLTVLVVYRLGEKCLGRNVGLLSALWLSIYVHHMYMASVVMRDTLVTLLFVLLVYTLCRYFHKVRAALWAGVVYVLLVHTSPQYLYLLPLLVILFFFFATKHRLLNTQALFVFLGTVFILSTPWTVRNYIVYKDFVPIGLEAAQYTRPITRLFEPGSGRPDAQQQAPAVRRPGVGENVVEMWRVVKLEGDEPDPAAVGWSLRHNLISLVEYGLLLPFVLAGVVFAFRKKSYTGLLCAASVAVYSLTCFFYGGGERARMAVEPLLMLLAFYGISQLVSGHYARREKDETTAPA